MILPMSTQSLTGGCHCGQLRYTVTGAPLNVMVCHCDSCKKVTGQPFFARAVLPASAVTVAGEVTHYPSSSEITRRFCPICGATVFAQRRTMLDRLSVTLGSLDDPDALPPTAHMFAGRMVAWLKLDDGLPRHEEIPPPA
jgi:hypothetical protein